MRLVIADQDISPGITIPAAKPAEMLTFLAACIRAPVSRRALFGNGVFVYCKGLSP